MEYREDNRTSEFSNQCVATHFVCSTTVFGDRTRAGCRAYHASERRGGVRSRRQYLSASFCRHR
jgi:hypothetical protein